MKRDNYTTDEHFIPVCYLRQFSTNDFIYQYDLHTNKQNPNPVPITSICYKKHLYEFKDVNKEFIYRNLIESILSMYEGNFATTFRSIQLKSKCKENLKTLSFLSKSEKNWLIIFLATTLLRNPIFIMKAQEALANYLNIEAQNPINKNLVLQNCLPIYKEINPEEISMFNKVLSYFFDKSFSIGVSDEPILLTSDNPVYAGINEKNDVEVVYLPLSPTTFLYMCPIKSTEKNCKNCLVEFNDNIARQVNDLVIQNSRRWIYSDQKFSSKVIDKIHSIKRNNR